MADDKDAVEIVPATDGTKSVEKPGEPPIVARLVVEIRSDGTRTIARGALQDATAGQEVAIQAEGTTPLALAFALARSMLRAPSLTRAFSGALRALSPGKGKGGGRG